MLLLSGKGFSMSYVVISSFPPFLAALPFSAD